MNDLMELPEGRVCTNCGEYKTREYFSLHSGKLRANCKACIHEHYERNKEAIRRQHKEYATNNKDKKRAADKAYYLTNRDDINKNRREDRHNNLEEYRKRDREYIRSRRDDINKHRRIIYRDNRYQKRVMHNKWRRANPDSCRASKNNYRMRKYNAEGKSTTADINRIYAEQLGMCAYCACRLETVDDFGEIKTKYTIDHIQPLSKGGNNYPDNLQLVCGSCNSSKHDKNHEQFIEYLKHDDPTKYEKYLKHQDYIETKNLLEHWRL